MPAYMKMGDCYQAQHVDYLIPVDVGGGLRMYKLVLVTGDVLRVRRDPANAKEWLFSGAPAATQDRETMAWPHSEQDKKYFSYWPDGEFIGCTVCVLRP